MTVAELLQQQKELAALDGGELFLGIPDHWHDKHLFRCTRGHVCSWVIKSEGLGRDACATCFEPCCMTFPEDVSDPIP